MKRLINKIELVLFEDSATGDFGLTHKQTQNDYDGFNAFWNGIGIFHDVFEHYFEYTHKYFKDDYAMNIGGEMAAMGHLWYYRNKLGMWSKRLPDGWRYAAENMRLTTQDMIQEAIEYGSIQFGSRLESNIPIQSPVDDGDLEYEIEQYIKNVATYSNEEGEEYNESAEEYKRSVTFRKIADLHRWGFRQAERYIPDNFENQRTLCDFMDFWDEFCKNNNAEDLASTFRGINFYIYKEDNIITWKAILVSRDSMIKDYKITHSEAVEMEEIGFEY